MKVAFNQTQSVFLLKNNITPCWVKEMTLPLIANDWSWAIWLSILFWFDKSSVRWMWSRPADPFVTETLSHNHFFFSPAQRCVKSAASLAQMCVDVLPAVCGESWCLDLWSDWTGGASLWACEIITFLIRPDLSINGKSGGLSFSF